ncbi:peptide ABC transporter [Subtercola boreus]|uniref:Peptide ABC transporter n=1 Tax=Subtercola boreus TaxID=120213 RepID=A0A3E0VH36_9MICO|nr:ABC transporter substrate-binding protein [Subtercola boreus]RFA09236.1 peptide ABC transporter [Subtercola boreus]TQL53738.1 peptide/nickel transport system substrate-binding protein [Subtercola boreus]
MTTRTLRRAAPAVALLGAAALLLTACAGSTDTGAAPSATSTPTAGGNLTFAISVDSHCIDPQQVGNNDAIAIARQTVASLTIQDPATGEIKPWLAKSFEANADATSFTFVLNDGQTYADGTPIDAASVKTNFEAIQALGAKAILGSTYLAGLSGIEVIDPTTVKVDFSKPSAQFLQATSTFSLGLLSTSSAALSIEDRCAGKFVGSGPFSVQSYTPDQKAVLAKRTGYTWGPSTNSHTGEAYLDTVTFTVIPEAGNRTGSLQSGQIDSTAGISATDLPLFDGNGFTEVNRANPGVVYNLYPNESTPKLADEKVRQAISKAIDRDEITATLLTSNDVDAVSTLSSTTPYFSDLSSDLAFDLAGAQKLLDDDGWVAGSDGIREKAGEKLSFLVTYWQAPKEILELVQQQLKKAGIDLQLKFASIADVTAANAAGTADFTYGNLTRSDPDVLRTIFSVKGQNVNHRAASSVDDVLDAQAATTDTDARQKLVTEAATQLIDEAHSIPIYQLSTTIASADTVHDVKFEASSRLDFYDAWVTK